MRKDAESFSSFTFLEDMYNAATDMGMYPSEFWDRDFTDIMAFIKFTANKSKREFQQQAICAYNNAILIAANLGQAMSGHMEEIPMITDIFPNLFDSDDNTEVKKKTSLSSEQKETKQENKKTLEQWEIDKLNLQRIAEERKRYLEYKAKTEGGTN